MDWWKDFKINLGLRFEILPMDYKNDVYCIGELTGYFSLFKEISLKRKISGGEYHDARIAAICIQHEIKVFYSADRDFNRFPRLKIKNPLV